jgi:hypothetical protein
MENLKKNQSKMGAVVLKKVYFHGPSKFLCYKIFASRSTFTATAQVITAIVRVDNFDRKRRIGRTLG